MTTGRVKSKNLFSHLRLEGQYNEEAAHEKKEVQERMETIAGEMGKALTADDGGLSFANSLRSVMGTFF